MDLPLADGFAGISNVDVALIIAGGALLYAILRWRRNTVTRRNKPAAAGGVPGMVPAGNPLSVREVAAELEALLAELEETSRRLTAQMDNRHTRLEQLLAEADERIRKLEALTGAAAHGGGGRQADGAAGAGQEGNEAAGGVAGGQVVSEAQRTLARLRQERGAPPAGEDPAYVPIYALADGGKSSREIAQELGRQPGEIELILALRQRTG